MEVREEVEILAAAKARHEAIEDADRGDFGAAGLKLRAAADRLDDFAVGLGGSPRLRAEAEDLRLSLTDADAAEWDAIARKALRYQEHQVKRGRRPPQR
jgi:hypothetical protein